MPAGFFGKLPSKRDFVASGATRPFLDMWEPWLQGSLGRLAAGARARGGQAPIIARRSGASGSARNFARRGDGRRDHGLGRRGRAAVPARHLLAARARGCCRRRRSRPTSPGSRRRRRRCSWRSRTRRRFEEFARDGRRHEPAGGAGKSRGDFRRRATERGRRAGARPRPISRRSPSARRDGSAIAPPSPARPSGGRSAAKVTRRWRWPWWGCRRRRCSPTC